MPGFDGTGPRGLGPMTGRNHCAFLCRGRNKCTDTPLHLQIEALKNHKNEIEQEIKKLEAQKEEK